jgi:hypothetical protein
MRILRVELALLGCVLGAIVFPGFIVTPYVIAGSILGFSGTRVFSYLIGILLLFAIIFGASTGVKISLRLTDFIAARRNAARKRKNNILQ